VLSENRRKLKKAREESKWQERYTVASRYVSTPCIYTVLYIPIPSFYVHRIHREICISLAYARACTQSNAIYIKYYIREKRLAARFAFKLDASANRV